MAVSKEVKVPDIGDFTDVEVIEVHVSPGDSIVTEDPLITLETEKAAMDVPAPVSGEVGSVAVAVGDKVTEGSLILTMTPAEDDEPAKDKPEASEPSVPAERGVAVAASGAEFSGPVDIETDLTVLGSGPGGYTAAFRAADLGLDVTLVERYPTLGGVCLNVGCIPSKALLHAAKVIEEAETMSEFGIRFGTPEIDPGALREWKNAIVGRLTNGLDGLAKQRKVRVVHGTGRFLSPQHLHVESEQGEQVIGFKQCIIAAGSESASLPGMPDDPRIMDSTDSLELAELPETMLVIGGGIIGLEMACVYDALGVEVSVVELTDTLMPGVDADLVRPLEKRISGRYSEILKGTRVTEVVAEDTGLRVSFDGPDAPKPQVFGRILVAVGRSANGLRVDADKAGVAVNEQGIITVDRQMRTNVPHIFAIGDIVGEPMLAHKATHEGKVAAEVAAGRKRAFDARAIPSVAYTDPEVAWVGVTELEAKADGLDYGKGVFPWAASGRSLALNRDDGLTRILFDNATGRVIGAGVVGPHAGDLIAELALAIEMGADAEDIGLTIHPHPTLSETVAMAAEAFDGTLTDLYMPKRR
jgi:dihydrolipoamide dehydrogenase